MTEDTGQDGLRALLRAAAAARTSTLLLRGLNPSECHATPTPRKARRESRTPLHSPQTAAEALHFGREVVDVSGAGRPQPSGAVVVGEEDKCADLPDPAGELVYVCIITSKAALPTLLFMNHKKISNLMCRCTTSRGGRHVT